MKIVLGLTAVLVILLGMVAAVGNLDGSIVFGEPSGDDPAAVDPAVVTGTEMGYLEFVVNALQSVSSDISTLGRLFSQPALDDEMWRASAIVLLDRIEAGHGAIVTIDPPARLQSFQDMALVALDHSAGFARIIRAELTQGRTELTEEAAAELMAAAEAFGQAEEILNEFLATHQLPE